MKPPRSLVAALPALALVLAIFTPVRAEDDGNGSNPSPMRRYGNRVGDQINRTYNRGGGGGEGEWRGNRKPGAPCTAQVQGAMTGAELDGCLQLAEKQAVEKAPNNQQMVVDVLNGLHDRVEEKFGKDHTQVIPIDVDGLNEFKNGVVVPMAINAEKRYTLGEQIRKGEISQEEAAGQIQRLNDWSKRIEARTDQMQAFGGPLGFIATAAESAYCAVAKTCPKDEQGGGGDHNQGGGSGRPNGYNPGLSTVGSPAVPEVKQGYDQLASGDPAAARASATKALSLDPTLIDALRLRAQAAGLQRDYKAAAKDAKDYLAIDPDDEKMQGLLAMTEGRDGSGSGTQGGQMAAAQSAASSLGGMSYNAAGAAAAISGLADPRQDSASSSLSRQARDAMRMGDYAGAAAAASRALAINPNDATALYYRSLARAQQGDLEGALADAVKAGENAPNDATAFAAKAQILNKMGRYKDAERAALEALERNPSDAYALRALAQARAGLKDRSGMLAALQQGAQVNASLKQLYETAIQAPEDADLLLLFGDQLARVDSARQAGGQRKRKFGTLAVASAVGGALLGLGLLRFLLPPLRSAFTKITERKPTFAAGAATPTAVSPEESPALVRGQFKLIRQIGAGGMGVVFEGEDVNLGRRVAIKRMRDELKVDRRERERFVSEAKLVAALHHPNIVEIYSIVEENGDLLLVFEYVPGKTLHEVVQGKGRLTLGEALPVLKGVADALEYAHNHAIIHRDLKPSNIMLDDEGKPRVMDFGIARAAKDALTRQAMTNTIVGTPPYMAPEQEQGLVRKESDVYSLAICVYEMLTGRLAFAGTGAGMLMNKLNKTFAPVTTLAPELPAEFDALFAKAFDPDPNKRFSSPKELLAAVEAAAARRA